MRVAIIEDNIIVNIIEAETVESAAEMFRDAEVISAVDLTAGIGWHRVGNIWGPPVPIKPPLEQRKIDMISSARAKRWDVETGGVAFSGATIQSDEGSQARITGAVSLLDKDPSLTSIDWEAQPGIWVSIDKPAMTAIGIAVGRHVQACFSRFRVLSELIQAAEDDEDLDAVDINAGWPV